MLSEIDSFFFKFKHLLIAEKDATLILKSEAGRAQVTLSVDLGHVHSRPGHPHHHASNGTSRSRRQERRAAACKQAAEEAEKSPEKVDKISEPVEVEQADDKMNTSEKVAVTEDVTDEFCSNTEYCENESREIYSFKSDFDEEDIESCLDEIFQNTNITSKRIILRDQLGPGRADYLYTLELKIGKIQKTSFTWPQMSSTQMKVFKNLKRIL